MAIDSDVAKSILLALRMEEETLAQTRASLNKALAEWDLATSRYIAVRDLVTRRFGQSPYVSKLPIELGIDLPTRGGYRFLGMNPGDAAVEVLREADKPLSLEEIVDKIQAGGNPATARMVNAALMNRGGVARDSEARYFYVEEGIQFE